MHVLTHALHYGTGVFEGVRAYETPRGTAIFRHQDHIERLFRSAGMYFMDIPYTREEIRAATHETIQRNGFKECYIRPIVFRGAGPMGLYPLDCPVEVSIAVWEWGSYLGEEGKQNGVRARVSSWRRLPNDVVIPAAKATGQYLNSVLAKIEADKAGYEEAILLDIHGYVCEGTGENLFIVKDGIIATPTYLSGVLGGINRAAAIQIARDLGFELQERQVARDELYLADEIFMTGTAAELTPGARGRRPARRHGRAGRDHARGPERLRGRAARPGGALRRLERRGARARADSVSALLIYDCTLRDGMQGEGMSLSVEEKLRVAHLLDDLGVPMIEAGFPASNPKEAELFARLETAGLRAQVAAFGMTRRRDTSAADDPALRGLAASFAPVCTLVGKTWGLHLEKVVKVDRDENLRMIEESVAFLVGEGKTVVYDAEHFFDGWARRPRLRAALRAGRRRGRRRLRDAVRHQRRDAARRRRGRHRGGRRRGRLRRSASTATTTRASGSPTRSRACARARPWCRAR